MFPEDRGLVEGYNNPLLGKSTISVGTVNFDSDINCLFYYKYTNTEFLNIKKDRGVAAFLFMKLKIKFSNRINNLTQ